MRIKVEQAAVELHRDVYRYLADSTDAERDNFVARLEEVRRRPIELSEAHLERGLSPYVLRRFTFGIGIARIAIFEYDLTLNRMRVLKCRPRKPREFLAGPAPPH